MPQSPDNTGPEVLQLPLPVAIYRRAKSVPDRLYLEDVNGERATYSGLLRRIGQFITTLESAGVGEDARVAVMVPQSIGAHIAWQAIAWLKAWEVPINNEFHGEMLAYVLKNSQARVAVTIAEFLPAICAVAAAVDSVRRGQSLRPGGDEYDSARTRSRR